MTLFDRPLTWRKVERILIPHPERRSPVDQTQMMLSSPLLRRGSRVRAHYDERDHLNRSWLDFVEIDLETLAMPTQSQPAPVLDLGKLVTFHYSGVAPSCVLRCYRLLLFYVGWNPRGTVRVTPFFRSASSDDGCLRVPRLSHARRCSSAPTESRSSTPRRWWSITGDYDASIMFEASDESRPIGPATTSTTPRRSAARTDAGSGAARRTPVSISSIPVSILLPAPRC